MGAATGMAFIGIMLLQLALPLATIVGGLWMFSRTNAGRGFFGRLAGPPAADPVLLHQLADEVAGLREELSAVHERLDFTERLLSQISQAHANPPSNATQPLPPAG